MNKLKNLKLVKTLINIWKVEDLRVRIGITLLFVAVYRFGSYVVLPGIDTEALQGLKNQTEGGLMSLLDMFSGGAFSKASIFAKAPLRSRGTDKSEDTGSSGWPGVLPSEGGSHAVVIRIPAG